MEYNPQIKQVFYVLINVTYGDFFQSLSGTHIFTAPLVTNGMIFATKEKATLFKTEKNLPADFEVCKVDNLRYSKV